MFEGYSRKQKKYVGVMHTLFGQLTKILLLVYKQVKLEINIKKPMDDQPKSKIDGQNHTS